MDIKVDHLNFKMPTIPYFATNFKYTVTLNELDAPDDIFVEFNFFNYELEEVWYMAEIKIRELEESLKHADNFQDVWNLTAKYSVNTICAMLLELEYDYNYYKPTKERIRNNPFTHWYNNMNKKR